MKTWRFLILAGALILSSCGTVRNQYELAEDDVYFSRKTNTSKPVMIPDPDLGRIMKEHPSRVDTTRPTNYYNDGVTPNPNAAAGYPAYRAYQDSLYEKHPELSSYYSNQQQPPFDLNEERKKQKAWARQQRRLARTGRNNYFDNSYYAPFYGSMGFGYSPFYNGWNSFSPGWNYGFGWNTWNGWNVGLGYNWNNWNSPWACNIFDPWCNSFGYGFTNPWFYNNWYNPGYPPYYYYNRPTGEADPNPPVSRPREMIGSGVPPANANPRGNEPASSSPMRSEPSSGNNGRPALRNDNGNPRYVPPAGYEPRIMRETHPQNDGQSRPVPPSRQGSHINPDNGIMQRENIYQERNPNNNGQYLQDEPQKNFRSNERAPAPREFSPATPAPSAPAAPRGGSRSGGGSVSRPR